MTRIAIILILISLASCKYEVTEQPSATGRGGELLVVIENEHYRDLAGTALREVFQADVPMMHTREPVYDIVQIPPESFGSLFETHRHIFIADISPKHQSTSIETSHDNWSQPQLVIRVKAPNQVSFARVMEDRGSSFVKEYINTEHIRYIKAYRGIPNNTAIRLLEEKFGYQMAVPESYYAVEGENFVWLRQTGARTELELSVFVATVDYTNPETDFSPEVIKARRDSITKKHIRGVTEGAFMRTYSEITHPEVEFVTKEVNFNGLYAIEARSYWRMEKEFMGGPFVNYTLVDPSNNKLVIIDGFVYYPNKNKRDYMRQVEALIKSINLNPDI